jgi:hypothetical protein
MSKDEEALTEWSDKRLTLQYEEVLRVVRSCDRHIETYKTRRSLAQAQERELKAEINRRRYTPKEGT